MGCKQMDKPKPKPKHKRGLWSPYEDQKLKDYILKHGHGYWASVPINAGLQRTGKSCRLRWINYLRPGLKRGTFSTEEEETILTLHGMLGNKWSQIAQHLSGRTDNEIKNHWHSYLKKRVSKMAENEEGQYARTYTSENGKSSPSSMNLASQNSSNMDSFGHIESSLLADTDQSIFANNEFARENCKSNLPRVLFSEWLSLDQFNRQNIKVNTSNQDLSKNNIECNDSMFQLDAFAQYGPVLTMNEVINNDKNRGFNNMIQQPLKFEDQIFINDFEEFISGEYNINVDMIYI